MASSPWGRIQNSRILARGIRFVTTASHGGIMVTMKEAANLLSPEARAKGLEYGGYICYEEDCLISIVLFELPEVRAALYPEGEQVGVVGNILTNISRWNPDYLIGRGLDVLLDTDAYHDWQNEQAYLAARKAEDPDLIVSALSVNANVVKVWTADDKIHYVTESSYSSRSRNPNENRVSRFVVVDPRSDKQGFSTAN